MEMDTIQTVSLKEYILEIIKTNNERLDGRFDNLEKLIGNNSTEAKEAVSSALAAQEKAVNAALTASKEAVNKAEVAAEKRFDSFNENFTKNLDNLTLQVVNIRETQSKFNGNNEGIKNTGSLVASVLALLMSLGVLVLMIINIKH